MTAKKQILYWLNEKRDLIVVVLIVLVVLVSMVLGLKMQRNYTVQKRIEEAAAKPKKVRLPSKASGQGQQAGSNSKPKASFFLKPSPEEVLDVIEKMGEGELPAENQQYTGLRVMWPVYFFEVTGSEAGKANVLLDVSEDGFGVMIQTEIDTARFPDIMDVEQGKKIWIAGEIQGVDRTGTGTIVMTTEEVRYQEDLLDAIKGTQAVSPEKSSEATTAEE